MYRVIETSTWADPRVKQLDPEGKLLFLYLITNSHAHVGGIYYLPDVLIRLETGIKRKKLDTLWDTLSQLGLTCRDRASEVVWVVNMLRYQGRGEKIKLSVEKHLRTLHDSPLVQQFIAHYRDWGIAAPDTLSHTPSHRVSVQEQEQEEGGGEQKQRSLKRRQEEERGGSPPPSSPGVTSKEKSKTKDFSDFVNKLVEKFNEKWKQPWEWWRSRLQTIQQRTWGAVPLTDEELLLLVNGRSTGKSKFKGFEAPDLLWLAIARTKKKPKRAFPYLRAIAKDQDSVHRLQKLASGMTDNDFG